MDFPQHKLNNQFPIVCILIFIKLIILSHVTPTTQSDGIPKHHPGQILHRTIRSPQLFSGRNVLPDLTQLKPPTLNDLKEFQEKMATLANLTALLEHAIAAEKTARTSLQSFVDTIKDQITGMQTAVNPDPENYWTESRVCGGLLVSQTGKIIYKSNEYYGNQERCTWTVRANHRSKIKVILTKSGLEEFHDYIAVTELINSNTAMTSTEWKTRRLIPDQTFLFEGPIIFVTFVTDGSIRRKGFQLEYEGMGSNINTKTTYQHFHFIDETGHFDSGNLSESLKENEVKLQEESPLMATVMIIPSNLNMSKLLLSLDIRSDECKITDLMVLYDFATFSDGVANRCCAGNCEISDFETTNGVLLGILKFSDSTKLGHFQMNWSTDTTKSQVSSVNECGGILTGRSGKISYKENVPYANGERCVWIIKGDVIEGGEIKIQLLKDGFEEHYDYVTVSFLAHDDYENDIIETKILYKSGPPLIVPAPFAFVEFYSDAATFGRPTGFELIWEIKQTSANLLHLSFNYNNEDKGTRVLSCSAQEKKDNATQIFIINTHQTSQQSNSLTLNLQSEETFSPKDLLLYAGERGNFSLISSGSDDYKSQDGILVILHKCFANSNDLPAQIEWEMDSSGTNEEDSNTDNLLFVKSDDKCGEMLFGDSGRITYKFGTEYDLNERCTWTIRAKTMSSITLQLMADGFESCCDGIQINKIDPIHGVVEPEGISISRENRFHTLDATALMVTFLSDHSVKGTGFVLEFQTKGDPITSIASSIDIEHRYIKLDSRPTHENPFGPIFIQTADNALSINAFALQHIEIANSNISVELKLQNLQINECKQDSVALYHMPTYGRYETLQKIPNEDYCAIERLAGRNPLSTTFFTSKQEEVEVEPKGVLIIVTKTITGSAEKTFSIKFE